MAEERTWYRKVVKELIGAEQELDFVRGALGMHEEGPAKEEPKILPEGTPGELMARGDKLSAEGDIRGAVDSYIAAHEKSKGLTSSERGIYDRQVAEKLVEIATRYATKSAAGVSSGAERIPMFAKLDAEAITEAAAYAKKIADKYQKGRQKA